jgi:alpha-tubulin suppressor-like RCC1 family protein
MPRLLTVLALIFHLTSFSQIDFRKLDSLSKVINAENQSLQNWQDSLQKKQDSIYKHNTSKRYSLSNEEDAIAKDRRIRQKRRVIFPIVGGIVFIGLLVANLLRKKKKRTG